jgi:hypothetical protein
VLNFSEFIKEWDSGFGAGQHAAPGKLVKVNKPGHALHGQTMKVVRRQPVDAGVEHPTNPSGLHWFNTGELHPA